MNKKHFKYKNHIIIFILLSLFFIAILMLIDSLISEKKIENKYYSFKYDNKYNVSKNNDQIILKHPNKTIIKINYRELNGFERMTDNIQIIDNIEYDILTKNKDYILINKNNNYQLNSNINGYKLLFEDTKSLNQSLFIILIEDGKLASINLISDNTKFDFMVDSIDLIANSFKFSDNNKYNKKVKIINPKSITLHKSKMENNLNCDYKETNLYNIKNYSYETSINIPKCYISKKLSSNELELETKDNDSNIKITITDTKIEEIKKYYNDFFKNNKSVTNLKLSAGDKKINDKHIYIYKGSYNYFDKKEEKIIILYPIDYKRIYRVEITNKKSSISDKIINIILSSDFTRYAQNIGEIKDGYLTGTLKSYIESRLLIHSDINYKNDKYIIEYRLPENLTELDENYNIFMYRNFEASNNKSYYNVALKFNGYQNISDVIKTKIDFYKTSSIIFEYKVSDPKILEYNNKKIIYYVIDYEYNNNSYRIIQMFYDVFNTHVYNVEITGKQAIINNVDLNAYTNFDVIKELE